MSGTWNINEEKEKIKKKKKKTGVWWNFPSSKEENGRALKQESMEMDQEFQKSSNSLDRQPRMFSSEMLSSKDLKEEREGAQGDSGKECSRARDYQHT